MNKILLLPDGLIIILLSILYFSCSDTVSNNNTSVSLSYIRGSIQNWNAGTKMLKAEATIPVSPYHYTVDSTYITPSGYFNINLRELPAYCLMEMGFTPDSQCTGLPVISQNSKYCFIDLNIYDNTDTSIGVIYRSNMEDTASSGMYETQYIYTKQIVTITGSQTCFYPWGDTVTSNYNYNGVKGWNALVRLWESYSPPHSIISYSAIEPSGMNWYYYNWQNKTRFNLHQHFLNN